MRCQVVEIETHEEDAFDQEEKEIETDLCLFFQQFIHSLRNHTTTLN